MLIMIFFSELLYMIILCSRRLNHDHNTSYAAGRPRMFKSWIPNIVQTKPLAQFSIPTSKSIVLSSYFLTKSNFRRIRIQIRIRIHRIHMFFDLLDPDPSVRGMDPDPTSEFADLRFADKQENLHTQLYNKVHL
jgi:hypothetical protein